MESSVLIPLFLKTCGCGREKIWSQRLFQSLEEEGMKKKSVSKFLHMEFGHHWNELELKIICREAAGRTEARI